MDYNKDIRSLVHVVDRRCELCLGFTSLLVSSVTLVMFVVASDALYETFDKSGLYHNITKIIKIACKEFDC